MTTLEEPFLSTRIGWVESDQETLGSARHVLNKLTLCSSIGYLSDTNN